MDFVGLGWKEGERQARQEFLDCLFRWANRIGVQRIVLPLVDSSKIVNQEDEDVVVRTIERVLPTAEDVGVELHLETALGPEAFRKLLERIPHPLVKVNYDSGNSSSLGFRASEEVAAYGERIGSVHIKDRILGGATVPLGTGSADFEDVFGSLKRIYYSGDFPLHVAN